MCISSGNKYKITNVKGGTVLDLSGADNKSIIGYEYKDGENQHWLLEETGSGWTLKNYGNGAYLGIEGLPENGLPVVGTSNSIEWQIWPDEQDSSVHRICVPGTTQEVDLSDHGNSTPGTPVTLWTKWEGTNQTWRFEEGKSLFTFSALSSLMGRDI